MMLLYERCYEQQGRGTLYRSPRAAVDVKDKLAAYLEQDWWLHLSMFTPM